jgi:hypothetical protein
MTEELNEKEENCPMVTFGEKVCFSCVAESAVNVFSELHEVRSLPISLGDMENRTVTPHLPTF